MKYQTLLAALPLALAASVSSAQTVDVKITNLTHGIYFTPLLVSAHDANADIFEIGTEASPELQTMAESGSIAGLLADQASSGINLDNPAGGFLAPAASTEVTDWDIEDQTHLSVVGMLLPTNDGFVGLDSWSIPQEAGTYTIYLNGYDAGTEANNELVIGMPGGVIDVLGIPGNPGMNHGTNGEGVTGVDAEGVAITKDVTQVVHIHRGNVGDTDAEGGLSDVDSRIHRWLNPVAKVTVTVK